MININKYYEKFKPMVYSIAKKFLWVDSIRDNYYDDLIAEGELGLLTALNRFNEEQVNKPSSYIYPYIRGYMHHFVKSYIFSQPSNQISLDKINDDTSPDGNENNPYDYILGSYDPEICDLNNVDDLIKFFLSWLKSSRSFEISNVIKNNLIKNIDKTRDILNLKVSGKSFLEISSILSISKRSIYSTIGYIHMCLEDLNFMFADNLSWLIILFRPKYWWKKVEVCIRYDCDYI